MSVFTQLGRHCTHRRHLRNPLCVVGSPSRHFCVCLRQDKGDFVSLRVLDHSKWSGIVSSNCHFRYIYGTPSTVRRCVCGASTTYLLIWHRQVALTNMRAQSRCTEIYSAPSKICEAKVDGGEVACIYPPLTPRERYFSAKILLRK